MPSKVESEKSNLISEVPDVMGKCLLSTNSSCEGGMDKAALLCNIAIFNIFDDEVKSTCALNHLDDARLMPEDA